MSLTKVLRAEEAGVNPGAVLDMLEDIEKHGAGNHSFILARNGKIAVEKYNAPYRAEHARGMFSASKGFISIAVGFLLDEGKLKLDTPILDLLPEFARYRRDKRYERVTVEALLTMHSGKKCGFIRNLAKGDYSEYFMKSGFEKEVRFVYSNDDVYMLSKIVTVLTGQSVTDYLMPRLFGPLGIERPFWELSLQGIEAGFSGLYITPMDLAKVCQCYLDGGVWDGKQVIPKYWAENAGKYHVELPPCYLSCKGYGYYYWGDPHGGFRFDGMFGQFGMVLPKWNAVLVLTDCGNNEREVLEVLFRHIPKLFETPDASRSDELIRAIEESAADRVPSAPRQPEAERALEGKVCHIARYGAVPRGFGIYGQPQSMLPLAVKVAVPRVPKGNLNDFRFSFGDGVCRLSWREGRDENAIECGMDGNRREGVMTLATFEYKTLACAWWESADTLRVHVRAIETVGYKDMAFTFRGNRFSVRWSEVPDFEEWGRTHKGDVSIGPEWLLSLENKLTGFLLRRMNAVFRGRVKKA